MCAAFSHCSEKANSTTKESALDTTLTPLPITSKRIQLRIKLSTASSDSLLFYFFQQIILLFKGKLELFYGPVTDKGPK